MVALLAGFTLAAVPLEQTPVRAANTASERLLDADGDGMPGARPFGGADRYETSLALANQYAAERSGLGAVGSVIVASGESLIDALTASSLAAVSQAPVLLTGGSGLHRGVARFIERNDVGEVWVVGGAQAIPDPVFDELVGLRSQPRVQRLYGLDRSGTAVAIAQHNPRLARWCDTDETAMFLANGWDPPLIDAIVAGPLSYALAMPILLTAAERLPEITEEYLGDVRPDRVIIVGGPTAVSEQVARQVESLGIFTSRFSGATRFETAVELAELMTSGDCATELGTTTDMAALINADAIADGVSSAPMLGLGLDGSGPIPLLLVGDTLPRSVRDFLAATPNERDGLKTHFEIVAIGGNRMVIDQVVADAVEAATTSGPLGATIEPVAPGASAFTLVFSDEIYLPAPPADADDPYAATVEQGQAAIEFQGRLRESLFINGVPASVRRVFSGGVDGFAIASRVGDDINVDARADAAIAQTADDAVIAAARDAAVSARRFRASCSVRNEVTVGLTHDLRDGDVIEVRPSEALFGTRSDRRTLVADRYVVRPRRTRAAAPTIDLRALPHEWLSFLVADSGVSSDDTLSEPDFSKLSVQGVNGERLVHTDFWPRSFRTAENVPVISPDGIHWELRAITAFAEDFDGNDDGVNSAPDPDLAAGILGYDAQTGDGKTGGVRSLRVGDVVTIDAGFLRNSAGIANRAVRATVEAQPSDGFQVTGVRMSRPDSGADDDPDTAEPALRWVRADGNDVVLSRNAKWIVPGSPTTTESLDHDSNPDTADYEYRLPTAEAVVVTAKWSGDASGAAGNDWSITAASTSSRDPLAQPASVAVAVNTRNKIISILYRDGTPTRAELVDALNDDPGFTRRFEATTDCREADSDLFNTIDARSSPVDGDIANIDSDGMFSFVGQNINEASKWQRHLSRGVSSVAMEVDFNYWIRQSGAFVDPAEASDDALAVRFFRGAFLLRYYVLRAVMPDWDIAKPETRAPIFLRDGLNDTRDSGESSTASWLSIGADLRGMDMSVYLRVTTQDASRVPSLVSGAGRGTISFDGDGPEPGNPELDVVAYSRGSDDPSTPNVDERNNIASTVRARLDRNLQPVY